jgi:hypothetical protein
MGNALPPISPAEIRSANVQCESYAERWAPLLLKRFDRMRQDGAVGKENA